MFEQDPKMTPERWREIQHWLDAALDLPKADRTVLLADLDATLRSEIETMIEASEADSILDHSPVGPGFMHSIMASTFREDSGVVQRPVF